MSPSLEPTPRPRRARWALLGAGLAMAAAFLAGFVAFAASLDRREAPVAPQVDGIVVLTGGADRIEDALRLLAEARGRRLLISGVGAATTPESLRRQWPERVTLFACCVDLDYVSRNTRQNAREGGLWAVRHGFGSVLLVTASYHLPRATLEFRHLHPGLRLVGYPVVPHESKLNRWWQEPALLRLLLLEYGTYVAAILRTELRLPVG